MKRRIRKDTRRRNRRDQQEDALRRTAERIASGRPAELPDPLERERRSQHQFALYMIHREAREARS